MLKYVLKRIGLMVFTFLIIVTICFILVKLLPLPAIKELGKDTQTILRKREAMGYNKPIMVQYWRYWTHLLKGDMGVGEQMYAALNVWDVMMQKIPYTVVVNLYSILIAIPLGLTLGIFAALKKNKWQDHLLSTLVMVFISVPSYVYAFLVQYLLCYKAGWFPMLVAPESEASLLSWKMFVSMCPAIISLGFGTVAGLTRFTRAELAEVLTGDYLLLARTKGLTRNQAI
ncbi:MAG: ABC transporter permease, partial [Clostridiales bacterium]|nr:ABC transporter permease [Clostridiales bacterium]